MNVSEYEELEKKLTLLSEKAPDILKDVEGIKQAESNIRSAEEGADTCRSILSDL